MGSWAWGCSPTSPCYLLPTQLPLWAPTSHTSAPSLRLCNSALTVQRCFLRSGTAVPGIRHHGQCAPCNPALLQDTALCYRLLLLPAGLSPRRKRDRIRKTKCWTLHCGVAMMPSTACKQAPRHRCPLLPPSSAPCCKRKAASSQLPPAHQFRSWAPTAALPACNTAPGCNPGFNPESSSWGGHVAACAVPQGSVPDVPESGSALHHPRLLLLPSSCRCQDGTRVGVALLSVLVAFEETKLDQENGAPRAGPCTAVMHQCCGWSVGLQGAQLQVWMLLRAQCCGTQSCQQSHNGLML